MPRRVVATGEGKYEFREYELPPLGEFEVRVRVEFAAPKHGTESQLVSGSVLDRKTWDDSLRLFLPRPANDAISDGPLEHDMGNMVVGVVTGMGQQVSRFQAGERVFGYGPICDFHQQDEDRWQALGSLTPQDAVCTDPAHVALVAVRDGKVRVGDDVAVFGLGAIGLLAVQIARAGGARRIFAVDPFARRREAALAMGATGAFDPTECDVGFEIKLATEKAGVDVALETSGSAQALHQSIRCLRQCGTVVHVPWGPKEASALRLGEEFHLNRPTIIGSQAVWDNPDRNHPLWNERRAREAATDLFRRGLISGQGVITPVLQFEQVPQAFADLFAASANAFKNASVKVGVSVTSQQGEPA